MKRNKIVFEPRNHFVAVCWDTKEQLGHNEQFGRIELDIYNRPFYSAYLLGGMPLYPCHMLEILSYMEKMRNELLSTSEKSS